MSAARPAVLGTYKRILRASQSYPSTRRVQLTGAIRDEFRANRALKGEPLTKALWLAEMELKRLETWMPTAKRMREGDDFDVKL